MVDGDDAGALDEFGTVSHVSDPSTGLLPKTGLIDSLYGTELPMDQNAASERVEQGARM